MGERGRPLQGQPPPDLGCHQKGQSRPRLGLLDQQQGLGHVAIREPDAPDPHLLDKPFEDLSGRRLGSQTGRDRHHQQLRHLPG